MWFYNRKLENKGILGEPSLFFLLADLSELDMNLTQTFPQGKMAALSISACRFCKIG